MTGQINLLVNCGCVSRCTGLLLCKYGEISVCPNCAGEPVAAILGFTAGLTEGMNKLAG